MTSVAGGGGSVRLRCHPGVACRIRSDGECEIEGPLGRVRVGPLALPVLGTFLAPRRFDEGVSRLQAQLSSTQSALDLLSTIMTLRGVGALRNEDEQSSAFQADARTEGFGALPIHVAMLSDRVRTRAWIEGISELVGQEDVVVEIGCGTGVLAVAAARRSKKVYAIEATPVAEVAKRLAEDNGVGEVVSVLQGWSTGIELPERADVLVSEILDDDPFREGVLEATADAVRRLLKPDARVLPRRIRMFAVLVELDQDARANHAVTPALLSRWQHDYGVQFGALRDAIGRGLITNAPRRMAGRFRPLSAPVPIADVVLDGRHATRLNEVRECSAIAEGACEGVLTYFEAELTDSVTVTTDPWNSAAATHWLNPTLLFHAAVQVSAGTSLRVRYRYPGYPSLELE